MSQARALLEHLSKQPDGVWRAGLEMVRADKCISRGVMYVYLMRLEDQGFVRSRYRDEPVDPRIGGQRREYQITSRGRAALLRDDL